jgi:sporulation-control protein
MKEFLTRVGIGGAERSVEPVGETIEQGGTVDVQIDVEGGSAEQKAEGLYVKIAATKTMEASIASSSVPSYRTKTPLNVATKVTGTEDAPDPVMEFTVEWIRIDEDVTLGPGERLSWRPTIEVPHETPLTDGAVFVWIGAELDIVASLQPSDQSFVDVNPDANHRALFDAAEAMGLEYVGSSMTTDPHVWTEDRPLSGTDYSYQKFRFAAGDGPYADRIDAVDVHPLSSADGMTVTVEFRPDPDDDGEDPEFEASDAGVVQEKLEALFDRHL